MSSTTLHRTGQGPMYNETLYDTVLDAVSRLHGVPPTPLHRPVFRGREKQLLAECIDSNFVSSVGAMVSEFEEAVARFVGARFAVATVNGTAALHVALMLAGVQRGDEVLSQALTFIATCNALAYTGAHPVFVDVDKDTLGMSPDALRRFLEANVRVREGVAWNIATGRRISACVPMHTFGFPARIAEISQICADYSIPLVEDAAESLGSWVGERHTGTFGRLATLSFNGNKIITTGGGGMIVTDDEVLARRAKHLTTTAKVPHLYEFVHDEVGYNYRLPNLNAALGCAQMEKLSTMLVVKADIANGYREMLAASGLTVVDGLPGTTPNYWLNAVLFGSLRERDEFLEYSNSKGVMARPVWRLMSRLPMYSGCQNDGLENSKWLEERVVNLPSSVPEARFGGLEA
ncbi:LegC family aminotransferase [Luteimonas sp. 8-5]|uniref:LegC family aminotransferase n=1 Tax=Luteimonas sp. 8-5 TaxID=3039387 RepID=UPI0024365C5E|nr:LegC family aminotransferase [Luteimonas sp. 8-5]MDG6348300.1 LegC family aminotransferase [Luteimonas sp. 8-5]